MSVEKVKYDEVYFYGIKPNGVWEFDIEDGKEITLLPTDGVELDKISLESDLIEEISKFEMFRLPKNVKKFSIKNESDSTNYYIVFERKVDE